ELGRALGVAGHLLGEGRAHDGHRVDERIVRRRLAGRAVREHEDRVVRARARVDTELVERHVDRARERVVERGRGGVRGRRCTGVDLQWWYNACYLISFTDR